MQWEFIIALILAVPVIIFPAAFVWYMNVGGIYTAIKEARSRRATSEPGKQVQSSIS
jgi:hypothetical protein